MKSLRLLDDGESPAAGCAWLSDKGRVAQVWLLGGNDYAGFRACLGTKGHDRFDHGCVALTYDSDGSSQTLTSLREIRSISGGELREEVLG